MEKKKVLIAVTNRSSYSKIKTIIRHFTDTVDPYLMLGNSIWMYKYGNVEHYIREDFPGIQTYKVSMAVEGDDLSKMSKSVGMGAIEVSTVIDNLNPDLVVTVADRYETLATALSAAYVNVPLVHIQGGEISGTIDDKVRNSITQLADYHFPATAIARSRIFEMKPKDYNHVWNYGCPSMDLMIGWKNMKEVFNMVGYTSDLCDKQDNVKQVAVMHVNQHGTGDYLDWKMPYIIVMLHADTKCPITWEQLEEFMEAVRQCPTQKIIMWNNIDPGGEVISKELRFTQDNYWNENVHFVKHIDPEAFGALMYFSSCIIGNSSAGIREATFLGVPSITVGQRQQGRECGQNVFRCHWDKTQISAILRAQLCMKYPHDPLYGSGDAGRKIAAKIEDILHDRE